MDVAPDALHCYQFTDTGTLVRAWHDVPREDRPVVRPVRVTASHWSKRGDGWVPAGDVVVTPTGDRGSRARSDMRRQWW